MATILDLRRGAFATCWLRTVEIMQSDDVLGRAIQTWMVWDGSKTVPSHRPDVSSMAPILRMEPAISPATWFDPSSQAGFLQVKIRLIVKSFVAEDYLNLWEAVMDSLYPYGERSRQLAIEETLVNAGATTGQWEFSVPAANPDRQDEDGMFACDGMMRLHVRKQFM